MITPKNDLHRLRLELRVTQATMAEHMGVPLRTYEDLETNKTTLRPVHMNAARWACVTIMGDAALDKGVMPTEVGESIRNAGFR